MSKKIKKRIRKNRKSFARVWNEFTLVELTEEQKKLVTGEIWVNNLYQVAVRKFDAPHGEMTHLSIKRRDKLVVRDWQHLQRIKNELVGSYVEGVELFPTEDRLVDTENYNLWCLPEGQIFPFGYGGHLVVEEDTETTVFEADQIPDGLTNPEQVVQQPQQFLEERDSDSA